MAIDLSILLGTSTTSTATMSPLAMYKKLQKLAEENKQAHAADESAEKAKEVTREFNNAAIRLRNSQYKVQNAQVEADATYFKNRAATATTVSELIDDDRFLKVLAYANGFGDLYINDRQRLRDILTSDLNDPNSVANQGTLQERELAKKYNFGATGTQLDTNGNTVGWDASGNIVNDATVVTALPAGLAKLKKLAVDINGSALVDGTTGKLISGTDLAATDAASYTSSQSKALLSEEAAPTKKTDYYEFEGPEFETFRNRKDIQADVAYYKENITKIKSLDDLFGDYRLFKFLLASYDLESEAQYPGKIRKILESDLTDPNSLANRFQDPRFKKLAEDINPNVFGVLKLTLQSAADEVATRYEQVAYEKHLDEQAPGVRAAIEFGRRIKDVDQTVQLLGDNVLREVVLVGNNIPQQIAYQDVSSQVTAVEKRVDVNALKSDQSEVDKLVLRYLTFKDSAGTGSPQSYLLNLFG
ncbi:MAG TPA: DUF1217 domain-containing protein [Ferrovibrio sp.]|uniref:DUF1217 domain-containing protein n=1 Tax=Ferrovibrio sp. TaxID=1917215 RepID=UPI002ED65D1E